MSVDSRGFDYPLDPQLQRLRWRLDERLAALAAARSAVEPLRERRDALAVESVEVARGLAQARARLLDPARTRHALDYLAGLNRQHAQVERELEEAERLIVERREQVAATQAEIDKLEGDRAECLRDHLLDAARRAQRDTDQDWIARGTWRARASRQQEEQS